jgi:endonuclease I
MKKLFIVFTMMVAMFVLASCQDEPVLTIVTNQMLNQVQIGYQTGDDELHVTKNLTLVTTIGAYADIEITWISSEPTVIQIDGTTATVNQQLTDTQVTLTAQVKRANDTKYKYFNLVVLKTEPTIEDTQAPVITGATDFVLEVGSVKPNWLLGVTATDNVDTSVAVTVDDLQVDLSIVGMYVLIYSATDSSNNIATITVHVTVVETVTPDTEAPVILGTTNFSLEVSSIKPNWLQGVTASDNVDTSVVVTVDDSNVQMDVAGTYNLVYTASDKANNTATITVTVTITGPLVDIVAPQIIGTRDIEYTIGDALPLYLEGIYGIDNIDQTIIVHFDDSEINLNVPGNYDLIYTASDLAGNTTNVIVTVYVFDQAVGDNSETYVENFSNLKLSGSSYVGGSFTGINNIIWQYSGARGDQGLNGDALTFGGRASDNSFLKATITNGIQAISLKHKQPFGSTQSYGVYVNGQLVGEFTATEVVATFEHTLSTPVTGTFTLEIKPVNAGDSRAQLTIDDLTWESAPINQKPIEQQNAEYDKDNLTISTSFIQNTTVDFKSTGIRGSVITWKFIDLNNTANSYVNLTTGAITVPETGSFTVLVSATITNATFSYNKVFTLSIGEGDAISIASARSLSNNDYAKTVGTITSIYHNATYSFIFIEDESGSIMIHAPKSLAIEFIVGDKIEVKASKNVEQNFIILNQVRGLKKVGTGTVVPAQITANQIASYPAKLVTVSGLISQTYVTGSTNFEFNTLNGKFNVLIPNDLDPVIKQNIQNLLTNLDAGLEVTVTAPVMRIGNTYYLYITNTSEVIVAPSIDFNDVAAIIKANLSIPNFAGTTSENLNLIQSSELLFGATITWVSSNTQALSHTGVITKTSSEVSVTLTYTIRFDGEVVETKTYNVTVASLSNYAGYYASLSNKSGQALEQALRDLIKNTGRATGSTSQVQTVDKYNGQNYNIYTGFGPYGNREHVWPNSKLGSAPDYDLHNLRAAVVSVNSARSNYPFTNQVTQMSWQKIGSTFYPGMEHVGDVARIVLYISVRYGLNLNLVGNLQMFLDWHLEDPVSDFELSRNGKIYEIQSNRNPFIDHPELVNIYFN